MDFCEKYRLDQLKKENAVHSIKKLKAKKQTTQQQKQAYHAVSLFYELVGPISSERLEPLENKDEKLARKKDNLKLMNANWVPVYDGLVYEIKLRHYSPKTLKSYHFSCYNGQKRRELDIWAVQKAAEQGKERRGLGGCASKKRGD